MKLDAAHTLRHAAQDGIAKRKHGVSGGWFWAIEAKSNFGNELAPATLSLLEGAMPTWIFDKLSSEFPVIVQAPSSFAIAVICMTALMCLAYSRLHKFQMQSLRAQLDETKRKLLSATEGASAVRI